MAFQRPNGLQVDAWLTFLAFSKPNIPQIGIDRDCYALSSTVALSGWLLPLLSARLELPGCTHVTSARWQAAAPLNLRSSNDG
jgi:hypothetical protein